MKVIKLGLLAEDDTDCDALAVLVRRIATESHGYVPAVRKYPIKGCAKLRSKAELKMMTMIKEGCSAAVLLHDLDRNPRNGDLNDERALRAELSRIAVPRGLSRLICIPVEELEAWFWSDIRVVREVGRGMGKDERSPHLVKKPKEKLERLSVGANDKPRYTTADNKRLAELLDLDLCAQRCPAFRDLRAFIHSLLAAA